MPPQRAERVAQAMQEELGAMLQSEVKDPRIRGLVSVSGVEVTQDLRQAKVYVSVLGDEAAKEATLEGLASAAGFLRAEVGRRLRLRHAPELSFHLDASMERGARIQALLNRVMGREREGS